MASMISSSSRKGTPPSVDPILPCLVSDALDIGKEVSYQSPKSAFKIRQDGVIPALKTMLANYRS
jgi:hypothetical protein